MEEKKQDKPDIKKELEKKLTPTEKKLLIKVLREKSVAVREGIEKHGTQYAKELRKAMFTAFIAAFGFLMALAWRDAIGEYVNLIVSKSLLDGKVIEALIITLISVLGILVTTKLFDDKAKK